MRCTIIPQRIVAQGEASFVMGGDSSRRGYPIARRKVALAIILYKMNPASRWEVIPQVRIFHREVHDHTVTDSCAR